MATLRPSLCFPEAVKLWYAACERLYQRTGCYLGVGLQRSHGSSGPSCQGRCIYLVKAQLHESYCSLLKDSAGPSARKYSSVPGSYRVWEAQNFLCAECGKKHWMDSCLAGFYSGPGRKESCRRPDEMRI